MTGRKTVTAIRCVEPGCDGRLRRQDHTEDPELSGPVCGATWPAAEWPVLAKLQPGGAA